MSIIPFPRVTRTSTVDWSVMNAQGSHPGEDNSRHAALAVIAVGALVLLAGVINVKVGRLTAGVQS